MHIRIKQLLLTIQKKSTNNERQLELYLSSSKMIMICRAEMRELRMTGWEKTTVGNEEDFKYFRVLLTKLGKYFYYIIQVFRCSATVKQPFSDIMILNQANLI